MDTGVAGQNGVHVVKRAMMASEQESGSVTTQRLVMAEKPVQEVQKTRKCAS